MNKIKFNVTGEDFKSYRKRNNLTQGEFAILMGFGSKYLFSRAENGAKPSPRMILQFNELLSLEPKKRARKNGKA